jgi:hypothetical protein
MAFYTSEWVRTLVKQDHIAVQEHISKKGNDFRSYIDSVLPFSLYLNIDDIITRILNPNSAFILELAGALNLSNVDILTTELLNAYKSVINFYIDNSGFTKITSDELQNKFKLLNK